MFSSEAVVVPSQYAAGDCAACTSAYPSILNAAVRVACSTWLQTWWFRHPEYRPCCVRCFLRFTRMFLHTVFPLFSDTTPARMPLTTPALNVGLGWGRLQQTCLLHNHAARSPAALSMPASIMCAVLVCLTVCSTCSMACWQQSTVLGVVWFQAVSRCVCW
jgi:hypothetical protein